MIDTLPADPDGMNDARAAWANVAIGAFRRVVGLDEADGDDTAVTDLICDLMHWCDRCDPPVMLEDAIASARDHYAHETGAVTTR